MKEIKTVSLLTIYEYEDALKAKYRDTLIEIFIENKWGFNEEKGMEIKIGWSSPETQSIEDTKKFIKNMQSAIQDAEHFPFKGYYIKEHITVSK